MTVENFRALVDYNANTYMVLYQHAVATGNEAAENYRFAYNSLVNLRKSICENLAVRDAWPPALEYLSK